MKDKPAVRTFLILVLLGLLGPGCGGGTKKDKIWIYHIPDFYQPELKRVAVLQFRDPPTAPGVGQRISDKVSTLLTNNGTYEVYTRAHLADIVAEKDLADSGIIDAEVAMRIGKARSVQALVCGACNRYETTTRSETRYQPVPIWGRNQQGQPIITGWNQVPYVWTRLEGFVGCDVVVIDTQTGRQIAAAGAPSGLWAEGSPPQKSPYDLIREAEDDQAVRIAAALAVTRQQVKLKGDVLRTARDFYDGKWEWQDKFEPDDGKVVAVVKLPPEADRNNFRLTIVPKESREVLAEQAFVWSKVNDRLGFPFELGAFQQQPGPGEYKVKLYSGPEPIATYNFRVEAEK